MALVVTLRNMARGILAMGVMSYWKLWHIVFSVTLSIMWHWVFWQKVLCHIEYQVTLGNVALDFKAHCL